MRIDEFGKETQERNTSGNKKHILALNLIPLYIWIRVFEHTVKWVCFRSNFFGLYAYAINSSGNTYRQDGHVSVGKPTTILPTKLRLSKVARHLVRHLYFGQTDTVHAIQILSTWVDVVVVTYFHMRHPQRAATASVVIRVVALMAGVKRRRVNDPLFLFLPLSRSSLLRKSSR